MCALKVFKREDSDEYTVLRKDVENITPVIISKLRELNKHINLTSQEKQAIASIVFKIVERRINEEEILKQDFDKQEFFNLYKDISSIIQVTHLTTENYLKETIKDILSRKAKELNIDSETINNLAEKITRDINNLMKNLELPSDIEINKSNEELYESAVRKIIAQNTISQINKELNNVKTLVQKITINMSVKNKKEFKNSENQMNERIEGFILKLNNSLENINNNLTVLKTYVKSLGIDFDLKNIRNLVDKLNNAAQKLSNKT